MKQLTCEMCGSTDVVKQDGFFVCQTCGCKYSVEEAKKMMIEGTVEVQGTVQVDKSSEIDNRIENIINEYNNGNNDNVKRMCIEVLNIDPKNYQAVIYSALAEGWQSSIGNPQIVKASNELQRAVNIIRELYEDDKEYLQECILPMQEMKRLAKAMFNLYVNHNKDQQAEYQKWIQEYNKGQTDLWSYVGSSVYYTASERVDGYLKRAKEIDRDRVETYNNGCASVCRAVCNLGIEIINNIESQRNIPNEFLDEMKNYISVCEGYKTDDKVVEQYNSVMEYISQVRIELRAIRIAKYWAKHPKEKEKLDEEKSNLEQVKEKCTTQIADLQKSKEKAPSLELLVKKQKEIEALEVQKKVLGLFKFKEKKALQEQIDSLVAEKGKIKAKVTAEQQEIEKQITPIRAELNKAIARIKEIDNELIMDRDEEEDDDQ